MKLNLNYILKYAFNNCDSLNQHALILPQRMLSDHCKVTLVKELYIRLNLVDIIVMAHHNLVALYSLQLKFS